MDWNDLLPYEKNYRILNRAREDIGQHVGVKCHQWVHNILSDASGGLVYLPKNNSNSTLELEKGKRLCPRKIAINAAQFGEIVQMEIAFLTGVPGPHTAIVVYVDEDGITFIESNWEPPFEQTVNMRTIPFVKFAKQVNSFTVYRAL